MQVICSSTILIATDMLKIRSLFSTNKSFRKVSLNVSSKLTGPRDHQHFYVANGKFFLLSLGFDLCRIIHTNFDSTRHRV